MIYSKQTLKIVKDMIKFITETYNTKLLRLEYDERTMEFVVCFDKEKIITRYLDDDDYKYLMDFFEGIPFDIKFLPAEDVDYSLLTLSSIVSNANGSFGPENSSPIICQLLVFLDIHQRYLYP